MRPDHGGDTMRKDKPEPGHDTDVGTEGFLLFFGILCAAIAVIDYLLPGGVL